MEGFLDSVIANRRSTILFDDMVVTNDQLYKIIDAGRQAPSAKNRQPWTFYVLKGEQKNAIGEMLEQYCKKYSDPNSDMYEGSALRSSNVIRAADTLILCYVENHVQRNWTMDLLSVGACIQNMLLKATELGLGTLWLGDIVFSINNEINEMIGESQRLIAGICVGGVKTPRRLQDKKTMQDIIKGGGEYVF